MSKTKLAPGSVVSSDAPALQVVTTAGRNPHYARLGGEEAVRRLANRFYDLMDSLPAAREIRALHPADLSHARETLFMFLSGWLGGPPLYAEKKGPPRLRRDHMEFPIDAAARDAWMLCMRTAVTEITDDPELREQLLAAFFKTADFLRNQ